MNSLGELLSNRETRLFSDTATGTCKSINDVQVIDAPCGKGKTSWAIQYMKDNQHRNFIYITPFLKEVSRIKYECFELNFTEPSGKNTSKSNDLKNLLKDERNIASTHELFSRIDKDTINLLRSNDYVLILDEVMNIVHQKLISYDDIQLLLKNYFVVNQTTCKVSLNIFGEMYQGTFDKHINHARDGRLISLGDNYLIWQFPPEVFKAVKDKYLLTYLFRGQIQKYYFDYFGIPYFIHDISGSIEEGYSLAPYDPINSDVTFRAFIKNNLNIYDGKYNNSVESEPNYSWYKNKNYKDLEPLRKATYNYFNYHIKGKSEENMWTTFKEKECLITKEGYKKGFVQHSSRATNDYSGKKNLAYLIDKRVSPGLEQYFSKKKIKIDEDIYSVSELIQWIFRSSIRNGNHVNLFLPSNRMRELLISWINTGKPVYNKITKARPKKVRKKIQKKII